jgi:hypothetical protein
MSRRWAFSPISSSCSITCRTRPFVVAHRCQVFNPLGFCQLTSELTRVHCITGRPEIIASSRNNFSQRSDGVHADIYGNWTRKLSKCFANTFLLRASSILPPSLAFAGALTNEKTLLEQLRDGERSQLLSLPRSAESANSSVMLSSSTNADSISSDRTTNLLPLSWWASTMQIVPPSESPAEIQPKLQPAVLRLSATDQGTPISSWEGL